MEFDPTFYEILFHHQFDNGKFVIKINIRLKNQDYGPMSNDLTAKRL